MIRKSNQYKKLRTKNQEPRTKGCFARQSWFLDLGFWFFRAAKFCVPCAVTVAGCSPYVQIKADLVTQSRRGAELVRESTDQRQKLIDQFIALRRAQLDQAFDADVRQRDSLDAEWVITARKAYAIGLDSIHAQQTATAKAHETTSSNLTDIDRALQQLQLLHDIEQRLSLKGILP